MTCKYCDKECKNANSLRNHERLCKLNPNKQSTPFESQFVQQTKKKSNQYIAKTGSLNSESIEKIKITLSKHWTPEKRLEQSARMIKIMKDVLLRSPESYSSSNVCGRALKSMYNGFLMHSSWETLTAKWLDKHSIKWIRVVKGIPYIWKNAEHLYFPDFFLPDYNKYIEVKGYETERDRAKWRAVSNLVIFKQSEITNLDELGPDILRGREYPS